MGYNSYSIAEIRQMIANCLTSIKMCAYQGTVVDDKPKTVFDIDNWPGYGRRRIARVR